MYNSLVQSARDEPYNASIDETALESMMDDSV